MAAHAVSPVFYRAPGRGATPLTAGGSGRYAVGQAGLDGPSAAEGDKIVLTFLILFLVLALVVAIAAIIVTVFHF